MKSGLYALLVVRVVCLQAALMGREPRYTRVVTLKQGNVQGRVVRPKRNAHVADVEVYLGIPYAAPPVGNLRFMPPGEPPQWSDTLEAVRAKPVCPQMLPDAAEKGGGRRASVERDAFVRRMRQYLRNESEDCLYLNIYVPHPQRREYGADRAKYPVILFVHGESFEWNSGNLYDGSVVAGFGNVIFITINFRLGIFGFLKQGLTVGRANFGLSDQIAALQWTKRNVGEFGGDAAKITVMGHGTGAACVNFLMLSPVAEGLFHRAILASGSALSEWALTATPLHYIHLQDEFNCSSDDVVDCLQRKRKEDIVSAFKRYELLPFENFTPVVDEIVVLNSPAEQMEKYSLFSKYDLLAGVTEVESYFLLEEEFLKLGMLTHEGHDYLDKYAKAVFKKTPDRALMKMIEHYLGHLRDSSPMATRNAILDALSDLLVTAPLLQTVRYHASTPKNTFLYVFGHRTGSEHGIKMNRSVYGDDLAYFLGVPIDGPSFHYQSEYTPQEEQLSEAILKYFTNFAKTGNPYSSTSSEFAYNGYTVNRLSNTRWPPYNLEKQSYMYFGASTQIRNHYRQEHDAFWNREMPKSMKQSDESAMEGGGGGGGEGGGGGDDVVENDDNASPPVYGLPPPDVGGNADNNFVNGVGWPTAATADEAAGGATPLAPAAAAPQTSSLTAAALVVAAFLFLLANVVAFAFIFYQRGKLRVRENLFRNRFRCKTVSVPDLFDENESGDIYAVAEKRRAGDGLAGSRSAADKAKKGRRCDKAVASKKRRSGGGGGCVTSAVDFEGGRVASVKPEAMSGKRMRRWPLSRQCSGSTITVDAHSKVRDWIVNEVATVAAAARGATPRFSRKNAAKKRAEASVGAGADDVAGAIEMRTIERNRCGQPAGATADLSSLSPLKVSVAVDATRATAAIKTRTGDQLASRMPIGVIGSAEQIGTELVWPACAASYVSGDGDGGCNNAHAVDDDDDDDVGDGESRNAVGTHKSSAHIRLKTPQFLLETSPPTWHSHSRSDPTPVDGPPTAAADALYSRVDWSRKKRLKSFGGSSRSDSESDGEGRGQPTWHSRHYEEINVTSRSDADAAADANGGGSARAPPSAQQTLRNLVRRNFPKVLPDLTTAQQKRAHRSSLPPVCASTTADGCADWYGQISARSGRLPPAPPPRVTSTLGRRAVPHSSETAATSTTADGRLDDGTQLSRITVRLKKSEPQIAEEEKTADLVQTESCSPPCPPPLPAVGALFAATRTFPDSEAAAAAAAVAAAAAAATIVVPATLAAAAVEQQHSQQKRTKEMRSVTTSTTGIS